MIEKLVLSRALILPEDIGLGRRCLRATCLTAVTLWTLIALAVPAMWPLAASAWVGWWILAKARIA